jgi:hypothetical protein
MKCLLELGLILGIFIFFVFVDINPKLSLSEIESLTNTVRQVEQIQPGTVDSWGLLLQQHPEPTKNDVKNFEKYLAEILIRSTASKSLQKPIDLSGLQDPVKLEIQREAENRNKISEQKGRLVDLEKQGFFNIPLEAKIDYFFLWTITNIEKIFVLVAVTCVIVAIFSLYYRVKPR